MTRIFEETPFADQPPPPMPEAANRGSTAAGARPGSTRGRLYFLAGLSTVLFCILGLRLGALALTQDDEDTATRNRVATEDRRIITDRDGRLLASTIETWEVFIHPQKTSESGGLAPQALLELARIFPDLNRNRLRRAVERGKSRYFSIARSASPRQWKAARDLGIIGMEAVRQRDRVYPAGRVTAHVLGGVNGDGEGIAGIERGMESQIAATRGPESTDPLKLSIDLRVQDALWDTMYDAMSEFAALGAAGMVMDVRTGELLAFVSLPDFDPNHRPPPPRGGPAAQARSALFNRVTQGNYELGSVFKLLTVATALDTGAVEVDTPIDARFPLRRGGFTINDYLGKGTWLTVEDVVRYSSNIGAVRIAERVGAPRQEAYLRRLGIGERVPLAELPVAERSFPQLPAKWGRSEAATVAYGHGIAVSPLHLATAIASVANDGCRVTPTLLRRETPRGCDRVVSREVSDKVRALMRVVGERSSGRSANIAGYQIGGKTGTAYKVDPEGGYDKSKRFNTFVAIWPTDKPQHLLMLSLDDPKLIDGSRNLPLAGRTSAPSAGRAIERIAPLLGHVPADRFRPTLPPDDEILEGGALPVEIVEIPEPGE